MLPIIDIANFRTGTPEARAETAEAIAKGCAEIGFLYAVNHGVDAGIIEKIRSEVQAFFARPVAEKTRITRQQGTWRGYIPMSTFSEGADGTPLVLYEAFLQGMPMDPGDPRVAATNGMLSPNAWPEDSSALRAAADAYWQDLDLLRQDLLRAFSLALDLPEDAITGHFRDHLTNISYLHYPARDDTGERPEPKAHFDTNALTILLPDPVGGLEVQRADGSFAEVDPLPGAFVVNLGNMMEAWSGGRFRSTMHRVNPPPGVERYSIGYFAVPSYDTVINPPTEPGAHVQITEPLHVGRDLERFVAYCDESLDA